MEHEEIINDSASSRRSTIRRTSLREAPSQVNPATSDGPPEVGDPPLEQADGRPEATTSQLRADHDDTTAKETQKLVNNKNEGRPFGTSCLACDCKYGGLTTLTRDKVTTGYRGDVCPGGGPRDGRTRSYDLHGNTVFIRPDCTLPSLCTSENENQPRIRPLSDRLQSPTRPLPPTDYPRPTHNHPPMHGLYHLDYYNLPVCKNRTFELNRRHKSPRRLQSRQPLPDVTLQQTHTCSPKIRFGACRYNRHTWKRGSGYGQNIYQGRAKTQCRLKESQQKLCGRIPMGNDQLETVTGNSKKKVKPHYVIEQEQHGLGKDCHNDSRDRRDIHGLELNGNPDTDVNRTKETKNIGPGSCKKVPYHFSGPTLCNTTPKERRDQEDIDQKHISKVCVSKGDAINNKFLRGLKSAHHSLMTNHLKNRPTTLEASLKPWSKKDPKAKIELNRELCSTTLELPYYTDSDFAEFVTETLHPGWRDRRRPRKFQFVVQHPSFKELRPSWNNQWQRADVRSGACGGPCGESNRLKI